MRVSHIDANDGGCVAFENECMYLLRKSLVNSEPKTAKQKEQNKSRKKQKRYRQLSSLKPSFSSCSNILLFFPPNRATRTLKRIMLLELHRLKFCLYALPSFGIGLRFHPLRRKSFAVSVKALGTGGDMWLRGEDVLAGLAFKVSLAFSGLVSRIAIGVLVLL